MSLLNDPNFEVTDLRTGQPDDRVYAHQQGRQQRRRLLSVIITMLVAVSALLVALYSVPSFGARLRQALHVSTPTAALQIDEGRDIVYFEHGLPWGTLRMDGKLITNVEIVQPYTGLEPFYTSLHIPHGRHQLTYVAPPFPALRCWVSTPAALSDTCPLIHSRGPQDVTPPFPAERVLNLGGEATLLPSDLFSRLQYAAAQTIAGLAASTVIAPGDTFAGPNGTAEVATSRMTATLSYAIATDPENTYAIPGSTRKCAILCAIQPASYINDARSRWVIAAHVLPTWIYQRQDGSSLLGSASPQGVLSDSIVPLSVTWDGEWHASIADSLATSPICYIALNLFATLHLDGTPLSMLKMVPATTPADGCLAIGKTVDATGVARIPFTVMYRFGLLFSVDEEAHRLLPDIRIANAYLQALARSWDRSAGIDGHSLVPRPLPIKGQAAR